MPEPPDFDQIARATFDPALRLSKGLYDVTITPEFLEELRLRVIEQLRQVWNARGAADADAVENRLATLTGWVTSEPYRQHLREAIDAFNR